jgi:hypothetical protein
MGKPVNFFDLATGIFFFFFLIKLMLIGSRELKREKHNRFMVRPATWLQYSQPPLTFISGGGRGENQNLEKNILSFSACSLRRRSSCLKQRLLLAAVNFSLLQEFHLRDRRM